MSFLNLNLRSRSLLFAVCHDTCVSKNVEENETEKEWMEALERSYEEEE
jgi:hypothetical protein